MRQLMKNREYQFALVSMVVIMFGICFLWWCVLVGGNPYHSRSLHIYDANGVEASAFHRGDWVVVSRDICLDRSILAEQSPALYDVARKAVVALPGVSMIAPMGCSIRTSMFEIPKTIPPGIYEYRNVTRFQNNLVGRDEANSYPPRSIEILP